MAHAPRRSISLPRLLSVGVVVFALVAAAGWGQAAPAPAGSDVAPIQIIPDGPAVTLTGPVAKRDPDAQSTGSARTARGPFAIESPTALPEPSAQENEWAETKQAAKKANFWLVLFERIHGPVFILILAIVFIVLLLIALRRKRAVRLGAVSAQSVILSIIVHLMLLVGFDSWVLSQRIIQTLRDPEFEILVDSDNLLEEKLSLGIREEATELPSADSAMAVAPQEADVPLPDLKSVEDAPPVVPGQIELEVYDFPTEIAQPQPREHEAPAPALAARVSPDFKIAPPSISFDLPQPAEAPEPAEEDSVNPELKLQKMDEPLEVRVTPDPSRIDLPTTEIDSSLLVGMIDTPSLPPARADLPERTAKALSLSDRMIVSAPNMQFQVPRQTPPTKPPEAPEQQPAEPEIEPKIQPPDEVLPDRPTSLASGAPLTASIIAMPAPAGVRNSPDKTPGLSRRALSPSPSPKPVPPPFTLEEKPFMSEPYKLRKPEQRVLVLERMGGTTETEKAVQDALKWLAYHQSEDGRWDIDGFDEKCGECGGPGSMTSSDISATALSVLAFMGSGHTHRTEGPYQFNVDRAIKWLVSQEKSGTGNLSGRGTMYDQGMATIALAEAYGMTHDMTLKPVAERAVGYIVEAQHPKTGGWRYFPGDEGDTSVFGWQLMALKSARMAGLSVPQKTFDMGDRWLKSVGGGEHGGLYGYQTRQPTQAMVAEGMFCRQLLGAAPTDARMIESGSYLSERLPAKGDTNFYYWYYGTLACFQNQGELWEEWNQAMREALMPAQATKGRAAGSWDPAGQWGRESGRVVQTAFGTLTLEVYYRYLPLYSPLSKETIAKSE